MKRGYTVLVAALLIIAMLCACGGQVQQTAPQASPPPTSEEPALPAEATAEEHQEKRPALEEAAGDLAFSAAMACWDLGLRSVGEEENLTFLWDATGWYAAWLSRVRQTDLLSEAELRDILLALGGSPDTDLAQGEMYTSLHRLQNSDASYYYDFDQHKLRMNELLGIELELSTREEAENTLHTAVTKHFDDGRTVTWEYRLVFEQNTDSSSFPWRLRSAEEVSGVTTEEALTFTWDELMAANRLENILSVYPAVQIYNRTYDNGLRTWYFRHGEEPAMVQMGEGVCSGLFHGCWFDYDELPEGGRRVRIGARSPEKVGWDGLGEEICDYFANVAAIRLDCFDGDLIRIFCDMRVGDTVRMAVDRGTLVLREVSYTYSEDFEPSVVVLEYLDPAPDCEFMNGWDRELRTVTLMWEDWPSPPVAETAEIPMDWEYLPYEARWGNYTAYLNENYTGEYVYPGDGVEYTLYLTTTKG